MEIKVVLPAPLGPSRPKNSPCSTLKLTSSSAWNPLGAGAPVSLSFQLRLRGAYTFEICSRTMADMANKKSLAHHQAKLRIIVGAPELDSGMELQRAQPVYLPLRFRAAISPSMPFWLICCANWLR